MGGSSEFHHTVLSRLRQRFPFKHWTEGQATFLGRRLKQQDDFSILCDQEEYASQVKRAYNSRERRRQKDEALTPGELILGAANWLVATTRPDIAALNAILQQRVSRATVADLIAANCLVG